MSSVPQVAGSGEVSSLELFGCRADSPPMNSEPLSLIASSLDAPTPPSPLVVESPAVELTGTESPGLEVQSREVARPTTVATPAPTRRLATAAEVAAAASALAGPSLRRAVQEVPTRPFSVEQRPAVQSPLAVTSSVQPSSVQGANVQSVTATNAASKSDMQVRDGSVGSEGASRSKQRRVKGDKRLRPAEPAKKSVEATGKPGLHRIAKIREQQGISERTMARRLDMDVKRYRELEDPQSDLSLTQLIAIQTALEVPICDLLEDRQGLSRPVEERAKMLKIMKTAVALKEAKINARADRMAQMLCEQLVDLMPELAEVSGWPQFGARRGASAVGKALQQPIDTSNILFQE